MWRKKAGGITAVMAVVGAGLLWGGTPATADTSWMVPGHVYDSWNADQYDPCRTASPGPWEIDTAQVQSGTVTVPGPPTVPSLAPANCRTFTGVTFVNTTTTPITITYAGARDTGTIADYLFQWIEGWNTITLAPGASTPPFALSIGFPWDVPNSGTNTTGEAFFDWNVVADAVPQPNITVTGGAATWTRNLTNAWTLDKQVTSVTGAQSGAGTAASPAMVSAGSGVTANYAVTAHVMQSQELRLQAALSVVNGGDVDGTVTVHAPTYPAIAGVAGTDCVVTDSSGATLAGNGTSWTVPAATGTTTTVSYDCGLDESVVGSASLSGQWSTAYDVAFTGGGSASGSASSDASQGAGADVAPTATLTDTAPEFGSAVTLTANDVVAAGGSHPVTYARTLGATLAGGACGTYPNTATLTLGDNSASPATASADVHVCAVAAPVGAISISAGPDSSWSSHTTYEWALTKHLDALTGASAGSGTIANPAISGSGVTATYTVTASATETHVASLWVDVVIANTGGLSGTVTLQAPSATINAATVRGDYCVVTAGADVVPEGAQGWSVPVAAGETTPVSFACLIDTPPADLQSLSTNFTVANTVAFTGGTTTTGTTTVPLIESASTVVDPSVTLTDTAPEFAKAFGDVRLEGDAVTAKPATFTYSRTLSAGTTGCQTFPNTASLNDLSAASASADVTVCAPGVKPPTLPVTGAESAAPWLGGGLMLIGLGVITMLIRRRAI